MIRVDEREARLFSACVAASVALHAAALALGPRLRHADIDPPRVLSVVLAEAPRSAPRVEEPPPRPPPPRPESARRRAAAIPAPAPPLQRRADPAVETAPARPAAVAEAPPSRDETARAPNSVAAAAPAVAPERVVAPDFRAAYLNNPPPAYPRIARRNGEQGTVTLRVHVSTDGIPAQVELERSSGSNALDSAALETVKNWRFAPARRAGDPVAAWVIVPVIFRLTSGS